MIARVVIKRERKLIEWIAAREALRKTKESGAPPPWTPDPILQQYRFCNVRRRHDRVSRWLIKNVLTEENLNRAGLKSFLEFTAFCRWNNWPPTIAKILAVGLFPQLTIDWTDVAHVVDQYKAENGKAWTGAYMINATGIGEGQSKAEHIAVDLISRGVGGAIASLETALATNSRREVWLVLKQLPNFGSFMSGQIVDDLSFTPLLSEATDTYTWAPQGPGSLRGFNRLMGRLLTTQHGEEEWCAQLQAWRAQVIEALGDEFSDCTLHDTQNQLCELDKFLRAKRGEGRPRATYKPETAY